MLVYSNNLFNVPVLSLQTGAVLAHTGQPIIDPRRLFIVAFYCDGPLLDDHPSVLHVSDIREFSDIGMIVNHSEDLMPPGGLVRLQEVINFNFQLIGRTVIDTARSKLGTVEDFATETSNFMIKKISARRPLLKSFSTSKLLIDRQQIVEVSNDYIVVRHELAKPEPALSRLKPPVNPFRSKVNPQTDV